MRGLSIAAAVASTVAPQFIRHITLFKGPIQRDPKSHCCKQTTHRVGAPALRDAIAQWLWVSHCIRCDATQVVVCSGSQHAIDLVGRLLLDAGDEALVEDPGCAAYGSRGIGRIATLLGAYRLRTTGASCPFQSPWFLDHKHRSNIQSDQPLNGTRPIEVGCGAAILTTERLA
jgi:hypothetical protein